MQIPCKLVTYFLSQWHWITGATPPFQGSYKLLCSHIHVSTMYFTICLGTWLPSPDPGFIYNPCLGLGQMLDACFILQLIAQRLSSCARPFSLTINLCRMVDIKLNNFYPLALTFSSLFFFKDGWMNDWQWFFLTTSVGSSKEMEVLGNDEGWAKRSDAYITVPAGD